MEKKDLWLWFASLQGKGANVNKTLTKSFHDIEKIYQAGVDELAKVGGLTKAEAEFVEKSKNDFDFEKEKKKLREAEIHFITLEEQEYPDKLKEYGDAPRVLFYKGTLPVKASPTVAMVGARACSNYGRTMAKCISRELSANGVQVISGMARGIDTYSQLGAIEGGTPTFAVLGCGVDICYPTENIELYQNIIDYGGGILSEYYPGIKPLPWHFPMRNRIISGLADKVAVVEAKEKSGSLITVEWALEQGKDIYALPGRANDLLSVGCNRLLKSGAGVLTEAKDILEDFNYTVKKMKEVKKSDMDNELLKVYNKLEITPKGVQELMEESKLEYKKLMEMLLKLQFLGLAEEINNSYYRV